MKTISPANLIPMDIFVGHEPIKIDLVYAQKEHPRNIFDTALLHEEARLWAHKDLAKIILLTARRLNKNYGYILELQDCLRTIEVQKAMQETDIVRANPQWCKEPDRLLAPPGMGAHPRAMAIDVRVLQSNNQEVDMGTPFDYMDVQSHRTYTDFPDDILNNRKILEDAFLSSAKTLGFPFIALQSEWWDFRFCPDYTNQYAPLNDSDLPPQMQMSQKIQNNIANYSQEHFDNLAQEIITIVDGNI